MATLSQTAETPPLVGSNGNPLGVVVRLVGLAIVDAFAIWFFYRLLADEAWFLAAAVGVVTLGINVFFLSNRLYAFRWFSPGLALMILMVVYPTAFTIYVAFTNYSTGRLQSQAQLVEFFLDPRQSGNQYIPEGGASYEFAAYRAESAAEGSNDYLLWLLDSEGNAFLARPNQALVSAETATGVGALDSDGFPETIAGYERLNRIRLAADDVLGTLTFGAEGEQIGISGTRAAQFASRYTYDSATGTITDQSTNTVYIPVRGIFISSARYSYDAAANQVTDLQSGQRYAAERNFLNDVPAEERLPGGYFVSVGVDNFIRLFSDPALQGPLVTIFIWTVIHALSAVFLTFVVGLGFALVFHSDIVPGKKILRSFILVPYAMPAFISVLIWRGLLSEELGPIGTWTGQLFQSLGLEAPGWQTDAFWARVGILIIQMWLGFPYMMLICMGALQAIPSDIYEAAEVDGANRGQQFWSITLPLLLVSVGPILISSFSYNFNNFGVIRLYNGGGPPITATAGWTDILISYTYRIAFSSGERDYGMASAITIVIFLLVLMLTIINFRFTGTWEEVSQNV